ncbi:YjjG family noncanonical pyrimidine nucleotidase [Robertkochia solimangrovi]|uniref:YjjG family noncanonical pyrimidine nucleotidase n=1 Tax=Robertkochia solimangrovi TaxID=2213046 RepID=UPI00117E87D9|nr:YjjG family noncanonical pyrimidine nucleotidase [Robertkochia solimangrovi]TRZ44248.1 noncanonical pyrimidine nucleotidase, YjjG family [Robertkochia solimangrovi]
MNSEIRHIFFDLDHTLWDFNRNSALAFHEIFKLNELELSLEEFLEVYEPINERYWKLYREDRVSKEELRYSRLRLSFEHLKVKISDRVIKKLAEDYLTYLPTFNHLFEDAFEILNYLKYKYDLHIITNGFQEVQSAKLRNSGIESYFKIIMSSEFAGVKKPNPYIFKLAMKQAGAVPENSVMIGDNLDADVHGAISCGMAAIHYNPGKSEAIHGIKQVFSLSEVKSML